MCITLLLQLHTAPSWIPWQHLGKGAMPGTGPLGGSEPALLRCLQTEGCFFTTPMPQGTAETRREVRHLGSCTWEQRTFSRSAVEVSLPAHQFSCDALLCRVLSSLPPCQSPAVPVGIWGVSSRHKAFPGRPQLQPWYYLSLFQP